jgi:allantoin racemase
VRQPNAPIVLVVNPNTNTRTTAMMTKLVRACLRPAGLEVEGVTVDHGPSMIVDPATLADAAEHVKVAVERRLAGPDGRRVFAVVIAAIGDPGRHELAAELAIPVVGIGQAAVLEAARRGRRFGMATSTPLLAPSLVGLVEAHGCGELFTGVRLTTSDPLTLASAPKRQFSELATAVRACAEQDGAQAVIIAGGPLSETARQLADLDGIEIVEPLPSASRLVLEAPDRDPLRGARARLGPLVGGGSLAARE